MPARVDSDIGEVEIDARGAPLGVVRMAPEKSYAGTPELLKRVIDEGSAEAWEALKAKIDYTLGNLDHALAPLNEETGFGERLQSELAKGKKLLFKPNLVNILAIEFETHGEGIGYITCTAWPFVAALMRWFHDSLGVSYHQMAVGESSSALSTAAARYQMALGDGASLTEEAVVEGRSDGFDGGWGFYYARRYLSETHDLSHADDPMAGYEDSLAGRYVPPGRAMDRLPVYDLGLVEGPPPRGREVRVPQGENFRSIVVHKAVVGGDPDDAEDLRDYPGCVLVNMPKLKVHDIALFTNAIKNIGIGLYPMQATVDGDAARGRWRYSWPQGPQPGIKGNIPHEVWAAETDEETSLPRRDESGRYVLKKTAGLSGTMLDIVTATLDQGVFIVSVVDAVETNNFTNVEGMAESKAREGYVFAGLDLVALDVLCARYMFKTVPMAEARRLRQERGLPSEFLRRVPVPRVEGSNIVTTEGVDSPISRYGLFDYAQRRGLGQQEYHVLGRDEVAGGPLASVQGHLGRLEGRRFAELMTETLYVDLAKPLWDLQATVMAYAEANDSLTGSDLRQGFLDAFDENGDGVIDYDEMGKKGVITGPLIRAGGRLVHLFGSQRYGMLQGRFQMRANSLRWSDPAFNEEKLDTLKEFMASGMALVGLGMSQLDMEGADPFFPGMTWGKGKWPSLQFARYMAIGAALYGLEFPLATNVQSLYGAAFQYADKAYNGGRFTGNGAMLGDRITLDSAPLIAYLDAVAGGDVPLPFVLHVPAGYLDCAGRRMPNARETQDAAKVFRVEFDGGREVW